MTNIQGDKAQAKQQKMLTELYNSSMKTIDEQPMSLQTPLGFAMEFARRS
jgi:hypothetical protein